MEYFHESYLWDIHKNKFHIIETMEWNYKTFNRLMVNLNIVYNHTCNNNAKILVIYISKPTSFSIREHIRQTYENKSCLKKFLLFYLENVYFVFYFLLVIRKTKLLIS